MPPELCFNMPSFDLSLHFYLKHRQSATASYRMRLLHLVPRRSRQSLEWDAPNERY